MKEIRRTLEDDFKINVEEGMGLSCLFSHRDNLITRGVVKFQFKKRGWKKKPIFSNSKFIISNANMEGVIDYINEKHNLTEGDYFFLKTLIIEISTTYVNEYINKKSPRLGEDLFI